MTVDKWRKCYRELGLEGLHDELRLGRPRTYEGRADSKSGTGGLAGAANMS